MLFNKARQILLDGQLEIDPHFHATGKFNNIGKADNLETNGRRRQ